MSGNNYYINFKPMLLNGAIITEIDINGIDEKGVFIPFRFNSFFINKHYEPVLNINAIEKKPNPFNQSHFLIQRMTEKKKEEIQRMGFEPTLCGNMSLIYKKQTFSALNRKNWQSIDDVLDKE